MDGIGELLTTPVQPWDAVVCTSAAVKATLERMLENWADFLNRRSGGRFQNHVQLPVIPLGVDCARFTRTDATLEVRANVRHGLGIKDDDIAVLFLGRLSFHAKAHPLPMYLGLEEAARRTGKRIHLLQAGWFANAGIEREFRDSMTRYAPSLNGIFLDGRDADVNAQVWFAADIFTSLSDNIQETFGLTPIEAMAAGLPVVVTDWDGYRDTVRNGVDGYTVPTWMPSAESGGDLTLPVTTEAARERRDKAYNLYCGNVSQCTAVDVAAAAEAYTALAANTDLRRDMGAAARRRAEENFDWRAVVGAYQQLWRELATVRGQSAAAGPTVDWRPRLPLRDDPFSLFATYPSRRIEDGVYVSISEDTGGSGGADLKARLDGIKAQSMNDFARALLLDQESLMVVLEFVDQRGTTTVQSIGKILPPEDRPRLARSLAWLAKVGLVQLIPPSASAADTKDDGRARTTRPEVDATALLDHATAAHRRGQVSVATEYYEKALAADPDNVEANVRYGELLAAAAKLDMAIKHFRAAAAAAPAAVEARRNLGKALFLKGERAEAIASIESAVELAPDDPESRFLLGVSLRSIGAADRAVAHLERCVELGGGNTEALCHLGLARKSLDQREAAMETFRAALGSDPDHGIARACEMSLRAEAEGRKVCGSSPSAKRVGLHMSARHHFTILQPLFERMRLEHWPLLSADAPELVEFAPDVVVVCDVQTEALRRLLPKTKFVNVRASLAGKNFFTRAADPGDFICVSSPDEADDIAERAGIDPGRLWTTGFVAADPLFKRHRLPPPDDGGTVLYAPTWEPALSSARMLGANTVDLIRGRRDGLSVVIRPHPLMVEARPDWVDGWRRLAESATGVSLVAQPEADVSSLMLAADVLVSDASGVALLFLALDRPMVLIDNPDRFKDDACFDPQGLEWRGRDMGRVVGDVGDLADAVGQALDNPEAGAEARARHRRWLFGDLTDGRAAERVVERLSALPA